MIQDLVTHVVLSLKYRRISLQLNEFEIHHYTIKFFQYFIIISGYILVLLLHLYTVAYEGCASFNTLDSVGSLIHSNLSQPSLFFFIIVLSPISFLTLYLHYYMRDMYHEICLFKKSFKKFIKFNIPNRVEKCTLRTNVL